MPIHLDGMRVLLAAIFAVLLVILWRVHRNPSIAFNLLDLLMDAGKVSRSGFVFMASFVVTSWIMVDLEIDGKMSEGYLMAYGGMWVAPLIARVIYNKQDPPQPAGKP